MLINGKPSRSIWVHPENPEIVQTYDQQLLPHEVKVVDLKNVKDAYNAIKQMTVRGAPLIGVTAAYGMYLAAFETPTDQGFEGFADYLKLARPTAVNLAWAVDQQLEVVRETARKYPSETFYDEVKKRLLQNANRIADEDIEMCRQIGLHALPIIEQIAAKKNGDPVNILTHCNAGWLATIDWGTATSPIYQAHQKGIPIHVWVDETRPRNQGANITAFELGQQGIPHTLIADNTGGHLMQHGMVDMAIVGTDRTTRTGDVANKIGTYLKALAANDNNVPFYVALPSSTIDWEIGDGVAEIPIETRDQDEVRYMQGKAEGKVQKVLICPENTGAANYGFDVTPARLVTGLVTERGICNASEEGLAKLFPEHTKSAVNTSES